MKFSVATFATVAAAAATKDVIFNVSDFTASCTPTARCARKPALHHRSGDTYSFTVIQPGTMETVGIKCSAQAPAEAGDTLPGLENGTCELSARTWKIIRSTGGLALFVTQPISPSSNQTGVHQINNSELEIVKGQTPTGDIQAYAGPKGFPLLTPDYS
ncbi:uncharacterized protein PG998_014558 [Apiospora kogelbergensis]|uniref:uncharacterized protein n=1 Tax=Apiospora kogelbergensis TaxID=1337665 RepID=UPI003131C2C4